MDITAQNAIYLDKETGGKGRQFKSRFLVPGLVKYDYGVCLLTKENADKFIQGFVGCPVVINHQTVTDDNAKAVSVGNIFSVWFDEKDGYYWCNGIINDKEAIDLINKGYSVSCQYTITEYSDNETNALHNGNPYDKIIENGRPEHLAIVNNPRYEGAKIAVNALLAENEDRWITIKPNGEENKGRHLLLKDGESPKEAIERVYKKEDKKEDEQKQTETKEEKSSDENIKLKVQKSIEQSKKTAKNPSYFDGFDVVVKDGIVRVEKDGKLSKTGFKYDEGATDDTGEDWNAGALSNLIQKWNVENPKQSDPKGEKEHEDIKEMLKKVRPDLHFNYNKNSKYPYEIKYREAKRFNLNDIAISSDKKEDIYEYLRQQTKQGSDIEKELTAKIKETKENKNTETTEPKKYTYTLTKKEVGNDAWLGGMADTGNYYTNGTFAIDKRHLDIKGQEPKKVPDIDNNVKKLLTETAKKKQKEENYTNVKDFEIGELKSETGKPIPVAKYSYYDEKLGYTRNIYVNKKYNDLFKNFELKFGGEYSPIYAYDKGDLIGALMPIQGRDSSYIASNSFVSQFKDALYEAIAGGIYNRLGELIASNEDKWITIHPHGEESEDYRRLLIKDGETVEDAMHRQGYYNKRQAKDEKALKEERKQLYQDILKAKREGNKELHHKLLQRYKEVDAQLKEQKIPDKGKEEKKEEPKKEEAPKDDKEILKKIEELAAEYKKLDKEYWNINYQDQDKRKEVYDKKEKVKEELNKIGTSLSMVGDTWKNADGETVTFKGYDADSRGFKVSTTSGYSLSHYYFQNYSTVEQLKKADTKGYEKAQKKKSEETRQTKPNKIGGMPKAKSVIEAEQLAKEYGLAQNVNFGKLSLDICNAMNESANDNLAEFPEIRKLCIEFGSLQGRNKSLIQEALDIKGESISVKIKDRLGEIKQLYGEDYFERNYGDTKKLEKKIADKVQSRVKDMLNIGRASGEIAHCKYSPPSQRGIVWNEKFKDAKDFDYTVGFHPEGGTSLKAICDHEFGHQINKFINDSGKPSAKYTALKTYYNSLSKDDIKNGLSGYATTNMSEWIAEGWAEYKNNPKCRPMAKKIGQLLTETYKEITNG